MSINWHNEGVEAAKLTTLECPLEVSRQIQLAYFAACCRMSESSTKKAYREFGKGYREHLEYLRDAREAR